MYRKELYNSYRLRFDDKNSAITVDTYKGWSSAYRKLYAKYLPKDKASNILELGAGYGFFLYFLNEEGFKNAIGVDISEEAIYIAKENGIDNVSQGDIQEFLMGKSKTYDVIVAIDVLEHFKKEEVFLLLQNIHAALKDGGTLLLQVPNGHYPFANIYQCGDFTHESIFTPNNIRQILRFKGFDNIYFRSYDCFKRKPFHHYLFWRMIQRIVSFYIKFETGEEINILSPNFIVIAQKAK